MGNGAMHACPCPLHLHCFTCLSGAHNMLTSPTCTAVDVNVRPPERVEQQATTLITLSQVAACYALLALPSHAAGRLPSAADLRVRVCLSAATLPLSLPPRALMLCTTTYVAAGARRARTVCASLK